MTCLCPNGLSSLNKKKNGVPNQLNYKHYFALYPFGTIVVIKISFLERDYLTKGEVMHG